MTHREELIATVKHLTQAGKGFLAADESPNTLKQKFDKNNIEMNEENRRAYREMLFTTKGLEQHISGVILFAETVTQATKEGENFVELLKKRGIVSGIKLDEGLVELLPGSEEKYTLGLDTLNKRAEHFYKLGCRFAKWRCVLKILHGVSPSELSIREVAYNLARYASLCQRNGLVPIVEPELLTDGSHSIEQCAAVSRRIFKACFEALHEYQIIMEGCLLKPHMITAGATWNGKKDLKAVAHHTVAVLRDTLPVNLGGVFFLSGGQGELEATVCLDLINKENNAKGKSWTLSFSYGRALQNSVVKAWGGKHENNAHAQELLIARAKMNFDATLGKYDHTQENPEFKDESMYVQNYSY